ncbi:exopolysaccharide biosynthesis protein [Seohaeicola nanhaiensis]|uniref:Exopolysaccharide biosynthesis protein n=1 Tax=Seohaeicola nanhaiensis TaxID=1387282 RepID=A0ABV9KGW1_9RHOB
MQAPVAAGRPGRLSDILDVLDSAASQSRVSIGDLVEALGQRSFTPVVLAVAVLMVSPLSGIPTLPTISAILICLVSAQALIGRDHLWLPGFVMRRSFPGARLHKAIGWLERPGGWVDRHAQRRLTLLANGPARKIGYLACFLIPLSWPLLEILPLVTSIGASLVALIAFGLLARDGMFLLAGYILTVAVAAAATWMLLA